MNYRYVPPSSMLRIAARELVTTDRAAAFFSSQAQVRTVSRPPITFLDDPSKTGQFDELPHEAYVLPAAGVATVSDATLVGHRTLLWNDCFTTDEMSDVHNARLLDRLASEDAFLNEETGLRAIPGSDAFRLETGSRRRRHISGTVIMLCSMEPYNYGSFLFRVLPKLRDIQLLGLSHLKVIAPIVSATVIDLLGICGIKPDQIIQQETTTLTTIDRVLVPSLRNPDFYLDPESRRFFLAIVQQVLEAGDSGRRYGRHIYVSRRRHGETGGSTRVMVNEAEVEARLSSIGFAILTPEDMTMDQQIGAFAGADIVVGPSGSNMCNLAFCRAGTRVVDIQSEPDWIYAHAGMFASCNLQHGIFVGRVDETDPRPVHRRWSVDVDRLVDRVTLLMRS